MVVGRRGSGLMMGFLVCLFDVGLGGCGGVVKSVTWMGLNLLVFFLQSVVRRLIARCDDMHYSAHCSIGTRSNTRDAPVF